MEKVLNYIESQLDPRQQEILQALHDLCMAYPGITAQLRFGIPFYYRKSWICYSNPLKNGGVECCFVRANELSNEQGGLVFGKRAQVAGVTIMDAREIPQDVPGEILQEVLLLDDEVPYASKRKK